MLDDAFRVGEYIQSGSYKGVVESFSLRSVKLRHQRGPLFTIPFGMLGAVQNMSRDWVIVKDQIGITYDSDVDKAKKLIKQIGQSQRDDGLLASLAKLCAEMQVDTIAEWIENESMARAALELASRAWVMESGEITLQGEAKALLGDERVRAAYLGGEPCILVNYEQ